MKRSNQTAALFLLNFSFCLGITMIPARAAVLYFDNFDVPNQQLDGAPVAGRTVGDLQDSVILASARAQQQIVGGQLSMVTPGSGSGRVRFQEGSTWFDWAAGATGDAMRESGGVRIEFDLTTPAAFLTSNNWISFNIGIAGQAAGEPGVRVNHAETDYGILFRGNGGTQRFDNGSATTGGSYLATTDPQHVTIDLFFHSTDDGASVNTITHVGAAKIDENTFTWNNNGGVIHWEIGTLQSGILIDNLSFSTYVPEPSSFMLGLSGMALLRLRRNHKGTRSADSDGGIMYRIRTRRKNRANKSVPVNY